MSADRSASVPAPGRTARGPYKSGIRRRQQVLDSAERVFGQYGYAGGSLRQIAELVGVSAPALIRLFGSKEGLLTALLERSDQANTETLIEDAQGLRYLESFARAVETNAHNRGMVELLLTVAAEASNPDHPARPFISRRYRELVGVLRAELLRAGRRGEIRPMGDDEAEAEARGVVALMDGLELQWLLDPTVDLVGVYRHHFTRIVEQWKRAGTGRPPGDQS